MKNLLAKRSTTYVIAALLALATILLTSSWSPLSLVNVASSDEYSASVETYLFVETAQSASLEAVEGASETLTLVLSGAAPTATYFSDRPDRDAGSMAVPDMLAELWSPALPFPNAALVGELPDGTEVTLAVELFDPSYSASSAELTFTARRIGDVTPGIEDLLTTELADVPSVLTRPGLFIDSGYNSCNIQFTNHTSAYLDRVAIEPTSADRWSGVPPLAIADGDSVQWDYKYHSYSKAESGSVQYNVRGVDATIEFAWTCRFEGANRPTHASCNVLTGSDYYACTARTAKFLSASLGLSAIFTFDEADG